MVELQRTYPKLEGEGIALYAVSYDSQEVLRRFAETAAITYPLLSDFGSLVIERFGLLNTRVRQEHDATGVEHDEKYDGVSYPIAFFVDENGTIRDRRFHPDYRVRESGSALAAIGFGLDWRHESLTVAGTSVVQVEVACEDRQFEPFQMLWFEVRLEIADGWWVYGDPAPAGVAPIQVTISPQNGLVPGGLQLPPPSREHRNHPGETYAIYTGRTVGRFPITAATDDPGELEVTGTIVLQACQEESCLPPETVSWTVTLLPRN